MKVIVSINIDFFRVTFCPLVQQIKWHIQKIILQFVLQSYETLKRRMRAVPNQYKDLINGLLPIKQSLLIRVGRGSSYLYKTKESTTTIFHVCVCIWASVLCLQEREGRKDMEPRSEDGQFEEVTVQQLPQVGGGGNPVSTQTLCTHW